MNHNKTVGSAKFPLLADHNTVSDAVFVRMKMSFHWKKKNENYELNWFSLKTWDSYLCIKIPINKKK